MRRSLADKFRHLTVDYLIRQPTPASRRRANPMTGLELPVKKKRRRRADVAQFMMMIGAIPPITTRISFQDML